jgi:aminoglycoside phosphotransferase (APT) family kinase protein
MEKLIPVAVALDGDQVLARIGAAVNQWAHFTPDRCLVRVLKQNDRRLVIRYALSGTGQSTAVVGKWFSTDRGQLVAETLAALHPSAGWPPAARVPDVVCYLPRDRALFTEFLEGRLLRDALRDDQRVARSAGRWLAAFHRSGLKIARSCGPTHQSSSLRRWATEAPALQLVAAGLDGQLHQLSDPARPVHYDFYHSQVLVQPDGSAAVVDLDEAGSGDPAFDVAHFLAHLELLAVQQRGDPTAFRPGAEAFREGYASLAPPPAAKPALEAFAWFKLAYQLISRGAPVAERDYALEQVRRALSTA